MIPAAALALASCQSAYDDAALKECRLLPPREQMYCMDSVDRNRRERSD